MSKTKQGLSIFLTKFSKLLFSTDLRHKINKICDKKIQNYFWNSKKKSTKPIFLQKFNFYKNCWQNDYSIVFQNIIKFPQKLNET